MAGRAGAWLIGAVVLTAAAFALLSGPRIPDPIGRGSAAPELQLARVGEPGAAPVSLSALGGKVVLVNFWATWCKPCEDEMPAMNRLYAELAGPDFELLAVSVDDEVAPVEEFRRRLGLAFPILHDPDQEVSERYQAFRFPETLLIDRGGVVVERYIGPKEWDAATYAGRIRRLIAAAPRTR